MSVSAGAGALDVDNVGSGMTDDTGPVDGELGNTGALSVGLDSEGTEADDTGTVGIDGVDTAPVGDGPGVGRTTPVGPCPVPFTTDEQAATSIGTATTTPASSGMRRIE
jgi:hypothetical protein